MGRGLRLRLLVGGIVGGGLVSRVLTERAPLGHWQEGPLLVNRSYQDVIKQVRFLLAREMLARTDGPIGGSDPLLRKSLSRNLILLVHPTRPRVLFDAIVAAESGGGPIVRLIVASSLLRFRKEVIVSTK